MALPSGQPRAGATSRRPLSYHPATSYQGHYATTARSQNYTTNYFESAAFRGQGHSSQYSMSAPPRNRTSNSLCQEHLATLSSEEDSDSQDEGETDSYGEGHEVPFADIATSNSESSRQNGIEVEAHGIHSASSKVGTLEGTSSPSVNQVAPPENEIDSHNTGARVLSPLLQFTDQGPSFEEFVEQQNTSSEDQDESSGEERSSSSADNSESVSSAAIEQAANDNTTPRLSPLPETEAPATLQVKSESIQVPAESSTSSAMELAANDQQEELSESSDTSASADDGGDSAEHGYIEFEPGYADGQSDTGSQCSDVEEDEIYIGDDIPMETNLGTVIGDGDLLSECLDMLSAVRYPDVNYKNDAKPDETTGDSTEVSEAAFSDRSKSTERETDEALSVISCVTVEPVLSSSISSSDCQAQPMSEEAPAVRTHPVDNGSEQATCDIVSSVENIPSHAKSGQISANESSNNMQEGRIIGEVQQVSTANVATDDAVAAETRSDFDMNDTDDTPPLPVKERYKALVDESHQATGKGQKYRNRSYYKAVIDSPDSETESQKLSKLNSALNSLLTPKVQNVGHSIQSTGAIEQLDVLQGDEAVSQNEDSPAANENQMYVGSAIVPPILDVPVSLSSTIGKSNASADMVKTKVNLSKQSSEDSAFALRHRILRDDYNSSTVAVSSGTSSGIDHHQFSTRTGVEGSWVSRSKLKYSTSDPLSSLRPTVKIPLNERVSDQLSVFSKLAPSKVPSDSWLSRTDLPESSVDEEPVVRAAPVIEKSNGGSHLTDASSASIVFDPCKLKDVGAKSLRETAILSSYEDLTGRNSKNKPISRSDQPASIKEITLSTSSSASRFQSANERNSSVVSNETGEYTSGSMLYIGKSVPYDPQRREKQKPPPVPNRNSSLELPMPLGNQPDGLPTEEPVLVEGAKDSFQNVTVRKVKKSKVLESNSLPVDNHCSSGNKIVRKPEELKQYEPGRSRPSQPSNPASVVTSSALPITISSNLLDKNGPSALPTSSHDPTGATKPRIVERATAIKKTVPDGPSDSSTGILSNKGARLRTVPNENAKRPGVQRAPETEHKSRIRSPSVPVQPLPRERYRSPSEPPELPASDNSVPPVIPPRSTRPNQISRSKPPPSKGPSRAIPSTALFSPISNTTASTGASSASSRTHAEVQRHLSNDPIRDRRDHGTTARTSRDPESSQIATRSPAIIHSDAHGRRGDDASSKRSDNQPSSTSENEDSLPARK